MYRGRNLPLVLVVLLVNIAVLACGANAAMRVLINNKPTYATNVAPDVLNNQGLVSVRDAAQALGAQVRWDNSDRSLIITGNSLSSILRIGQRQGILNGEPIYFNYPPAIYGGEAYAPIILFNKLYNTALIYDDYYRKFKWIPIQPGPNYYSSPPPVVYGPAYYYGPPQSTGNNAQPTITVGEVVRVYPSDTQPTITVSISGMNTMYAVPKDAIILRGRVGGQAAEVPLGRVRPGDRVTLQLNARGDITSIRAQYLQISGKVQAIAKNTVLLESGETISISTGTDVILSGNNHGDITGLHAGDTIIASVSPISGKAYLIRVTTGTVGTQPASVTPQLPPQIVLNTTGMLSSGDILIVTFRAQAGGKAQFSIPGIKTSIPMTETSPGIYQGKYAVQSGDTAIRQSVTINFTAPDGTGYERTSQPITIQTIAGYFPRITIPHQGEEVGSPLVVEGIAQPDDMIRVTVEYRADLQQVLPIEGICDVQDLTADGDGRWQTRALALATPFIEDRSTPQLPKDPIFDLLFNLPDEKPVVYTITAASISPDGTPKQSYSVEVTKGPGRVIEGFTPR